MATPLEIITAIAKAPANRIINSINPIINLPVQLLLDRSFYPDVFNPRSIYSGYDHVARSLGLSDELKQIQKRVFGISAPGRPYVERLESFLISSRQRGENDYYVIRNKMFKYLEDKRGQITGFKMTELGEALRNYRKSILYGDALSAQLAVNKMIELDATASDLNRSIKRNSPIGMLGKADQVKFIGLLTAKEKDQLVNANTWYYKLMKGGADNVIH